MAGLAFIFLCAYLEKNYEDAYEEYTTKKPMNVTWNNLTSLALSTILVWLECLGLSNEIIYCMVMLSSSLMFNIILSSCLKSCYKTICAILAGFIVICLCIMCFLH